MDDTFVTRFLGGSPLTVLVRLVIVSLLVGALMSWLGIDAAEVFDEAERGLRHLWNNGFLALGHLGRTLVGGAFVVVPVWLVLRVLRFTGGGTRLSSGHRGAAPQAGPASEPASRWGSPERVGDDRRI